ncbi:MAG: C45 family autoproteolytic acyltransferase/hydrolase [Armatimonadota bacterium]|jgi:isopenicillin-N N-acyltransferase-like protein
MEIITLTGTPEEMARQHAEACYDSAREMIRARCDLALRRGRETREMLTMDRCLQTAAEHLPAHEDYSPAVYAEFIALADALDVGADELLIGNGYTDYIDVLQGELADEECTSFIATGAATADGFTYVGQTWDMHAFAEPHMRVFRREPEDGPAWVTLTTSGCLSLIGLSEAQIAVGNTNVAPRDALPGVIYLAMIHEALRSPDYASARAAIEWAPRASGHYYYVASISGSVTGIETTATLHTALPMPEGLLVHANHYHDGELAELSRNEAGENSIAREGMLDGYLRERVGELTLEHFIEGLRLSEGRHPVCRPPTDDPDAGTTCAAAIICPELRKAWLAPGNPATTDFEEVRV